MAEAKGSIVFRDYVVDGVPSSGVNNPTKSEVRDWTAYIEMLTDAAITANSATLPSIGALTWSALSGLSTTPFVDGQIAEVPDTDTGTHNAASATGYDGTSGVPNAGRFVLNKTWGRWVYNSENAISSKVNKADLNEVKKPRDGIIAIPIAYDAAGKLMIWLDPTGNVDLIPSETMKDRINTVIFPTYPARDAPDMYGLVKDAAGKIVIGLSATDGSVSFRPSATLLAAIGTQTQYYSQANIRGTYSIFNVRPSPSFWYATTQDRASRVFDVKQRISGSYPTLIKDTSSPIELLLFSGQSNAGEGGANGVSISTSLYPATTYGLGGSTNSQAYGTSLLDMSAWSDLVEAKDLPGGVGVHGQYPATMAAFALSRINADRFRTDPAYTVFSSWEGSQPITSFFPATSGHYNHENLIAGIGKAAAAAMLYGRSIVANALFFIQGENSTFTPYGSYDAALTALAAAVLPAIKTATGQATNPILIVAQTNPATVAGSNTSAAGQWAIAKSDATVVLGAPMYCCPLGSDQLHLNAIGRMIQGEQLADAYASVVDTGDFKPLQPLSAVRTGTTIDVTFEGQLPLSFDTDWVPTVTNKGFSFTDSTSSATVTNAVIVGTNVVRLTLSGTPSGSSPKVRYAWDDNYSATTGWTWKLGNLYCDTKKPSPYYREGFAVPPTIRHYSVRFEIPVS